MKLFRCDNEVLDPVEERFNSMVDLIKDLPKADYKRLCESMDLVWEAYQKVRNVKTQEEKEIDKELKKNADIDIISKALEEEIK